MIRIVWKGLVCASFVVAVLVAATCLSSADWRDYVDDDPPHAPVEEIEDDPAWEEYAFDLPFADGEGRLAFEDLARSGDPFVLFWWQTECPKCHLQMPYVERLQNQIDNSGLKLAVVSICIDPSRSKCLDVVKEKKLSFSVLMDERGRRTVKKYKKLESGTPQAYLFGIGGKFVNTIDGFQGNFGTTVMEALDIEPVVED